RRIDDTGSNPEPPFLHAFNVVVDHDMVLADHADAARAALAIAEEKVAFNTAAVAVAQCEHAGTIAKRVEAIDVFAGFVGDDFNLAVALLKEVALHKRSGVGHRLMTVTDANGFTAVAAQWRAGTKIIMIDHVMVRLAFDFDLQGRVNAGFAGKVAMVNAVRRAA